MQNSKNTYLVPVELSQTTISEFLDLYYYEYKVFPDKNDPKFSQICFIDINGLIIGKHMPTKLKSVYDKAAEQLKSNTAKVVEEVKTLTTDVSGILNSVASEVKKDVTGTVSIAGKQANKIWNRIKSIKKPATHSEKEV